LLTICLFPTLWLVCDAVASSRTGREGEREEREEKEGERREEGKGKPFYLWQCTSAVQCSAVQYSVFKNAKSNMDYIL
jgi:hypothetical protein